MEQLIYRISRLLSVILILSNLLFIGLVYERWEYGTGEWISFPTETVALILWFALIMWIVVFVFNWLGVGKITIWVEKPAPKDEE